MNLCVLKVYPKENVFGIKKLHLMLVKLDLVKILIKLQVMKRVITF